MIHRTYEGNKERNKGTVSHIKVKCCVKGRGKKAELWIYGNGVTAKGILKLRW